MCDYKRCDNCGYVCNSLNKFCPKCDKEFSIHEDKNDNRPVFNILD